MHADSQMKCRDLRERITRSAYDVDPHDVAAAVIVRLATCGAESYRPQRCGPSRRFFVQRPGRHAG
jgi:hypothetical protein